MAGLDCSDNVSHTQKKGEYASAVENFKNAVMTVPKGERSREGGQYTIWLAQALDAKGEKGIVSLSPSFRNLSQRLTSTASGDGYSLGVLNSCLPFNEGCAIGTLNAKF